MTTYLGGRLRKFRIRVEGLGLRMLKGSGWLIGAFEGFCDCNPYWGLWTESFWGLLDHGVHWLVASLNLQASSWRKHLEAPGHS